MLNLASVIWQEKEYKCIQIRRNKTIFTHRQYDVFGRKPQRFYPKKLLDLMSDFSKITEYGNQYIGINCFSVS